MDLQQVRDLIDQREHTATATAHRLRDQIAVLSEQLAVVEAELADLDTTRHTLTTLAGDPATAATAAVAATLQESVRPSPTYAQVLDTFTGTAAMRAKDICLALGLDPIPKNTESIRAKLKRLVTQGTLREDHPGLFALDPTRNDHSN